MIGIEEIKQELKTILSPKRYEHSLGAMEKAIEQSKAYGHSLQREVAYLTAHSVLHLLGYDHIESMERVRMREKEELIMTKLGLPASSSYIVSE